jgi:hypothetical protein
MRDRLDQLGAMSTTLQGNPSVQITSTRASSPSRPAPCTGSRTASGAAITTTMPKINNQHRKAQFALALAGGSTAIAWARENDVPESTIYKWANCDEVQEAVDRIRREVWQLTIARLSQNATGAADQIAKLAQEAKSESVRLSASRAVLADLMAATDYAALERRLAKIERRLRDEERASVRGADPESGSSGPATDDHSPRRRKRACPA